MTDKSISIDAVLSPKSVAVIGASDDVGRIGGRPIASLLKAGFAGSIYPVNPKRKTVQGLECFPSVSALPEVPDAALIAVPAHLVPDTLEALGEKGCKAVSLFAAGFAETGAQGEAAQNALLAIADRYGMRLLGPNTLGVYNTQIGYFGTFSSAFDARMPLKGNIGIASQSGAFGAHLGALAQAREIGTSVFVATGNEADLTVADAVIWMAEDVGTDVICVYLEAINDAEGLLRGLDLARANSKPVIILKAGSSSIGAQAAASHTASMAGDFAVAKTVLEEHGAVLVHDLDTMMDIAYVTAKKVFPKKRTLGVVTVSGGAGIVVSDEAERLGLPLPRMPETAQAALLKRLPFASAVNPLDCTAQAVNDLDLLEVFTRAALEEGGYGGVLCFLTYVAGSPIMADAIIEKLAPLHQAFPDTILTVCAIGEKSVLERYDHAGISVFTDPVRAVKSMDAAMRFGEHFSAKPTNRNLKFPTIAQLGSKSPNEAEAKVMLSQVGIASPPEVVVNDAEDAAMQAAKIGFPMVMKILSADILHKSDIGGVKIGIASGSDVHKAYDSILNAAKTRAPHATIDGVLVAKQIEGGVECFMGIKRDPSFGPVAAFGLGGIFVEVLKDIALRQCPFDAAEARETILSIKGAAILQGVRGQPAADIDALAEMLSRLSRFAISAGPNLDAIDLNPVIALPKGQGAYPLDAVIACNGTDRSISN